MQLDVRKHQPTCNCCVAPPHIAWTPPAKHEETLENKLLSDRKKSERACSALVRRTHIAHEQLMLRPCFSGRGGWNSVRPSQRLRPLTSSFMSRGAPLGIAVRGPSHEPPRSPRAASQLSGGCLAPPRSIIVSLPRHADLQPRRDESSTGSRHIAPPGLARLLISTIGVFRVHPPHVCGQGRRLLLGPVQHARRDRN